MREVAIIHYDEIALKGGNRAFFEKVLIDNIYKKTKIKPIKKHGYLILDIKNKDKNFVQNILLNTPGIAYFGIGYLIQKTNDEDSVQKLCDIAGEICKDEKNKTFAARVKRVDKSFPVFSQDLEKQIGACILQKNSTLKVKLKKPELTILAEIHNDAFLIYKKVKSIGGLPVGSSGKGLFLLSGGFDSPVASYLMIKRGVSPTFLHFHSLPQTTEKSIEKVKQLSTILANYAGGAELILVPVLPVMRYIHKNIKDKELKMVMLRRVFFKISSIFAQQNNIPLITTGDSLGQVASQTIENMFASSYGIDVFIARPLIGFSKNEIIKLAEEIGTYKISAKPHDDTCALFVPKHPKTKTNLTALLDEERNLQELDNYIQDALINMKKITYEL